MDESFGIFAGTSNSEFESILRIKNWVAEQWPHSIPDPYPPWDAIVILDWIREGRTGGFCGQYSQVMLQSLAAFGIQARYIEIGSVDSPMAHFVIEVWSNEFDKWVVLDADFNVHFERDGIPLDALELHDALLRGDTDRIVDVLGEHRIGHDYPSRFPLRTIELYYYVRVMLKANHLSVPDEHPFDRTNDMVEWHDDRSVPWEQSVVASDYPHTLLTTQMTRDRDTFNGKLNQVKITVEEVGANEIALRFATNHQRFHAYQVKEVNMVTGHIKSFWGRQFSPTFRWRPVSGYRLEVRAVDRDNRPGPPAIIEARFGSR
jgi:hypothetical protein